MFQSFKTDAERSAWIIQNADYFTVIRFRSRGYDRIEAASLEEAIWQAERKVAADPELRLMVYAVQGVQSCYVTTIKGS